MLVKAFGCACCGIDALTVTIETDVSVGINLFLVGLPDSAVRESQQRITTAFQALGLRMPGRRVVINMAPADLRKEGSAYDLPIALSILAASGQIQAADLGSFVCMGELALDGRLRPVRGALPIALHAKSEGFSACVFPLENAFEAAAVEGIRIYGAAHLAEVIGLLEGKKEMEPLRLPDWAELEGSPFQGLDFADVKGQESAKRALEIAAAGGHNVLMMGPPGAGKSFMAKCLPSILPPLTKEEAMETTQIYSVAGKNLWEQGRPQGEPGLMRRRPFRAPHHSASMISLVGGGTNVLPGEISLAHHGVLYLDEIPEFSRHALEVLRQPLEERMITLSRLRYRVSYPANFMLVASMNPCPCGYYGDASGKCTCTPAMVQRYMGRISGPLMDRIDLHVLVEALSTEYLIENAVAEDSVMIRTRVMRARETQRVRFQKDLGIFANAQMMRRQLQQYCKLGTDSVGFLKQSIHSLGLSARAYDRVLKMARTIADLEGAKELKMEHLAEAVQYRMN